MDTDSSYKAHSAAGEQNSSTDAELEPVAQQSRIQRLTVLEKSRHPYPGSLVQDDHTKESRAERWERLQSHYNDSYLSLLNESGYDGIDNGQDDLRPSQCGSVAWSILEKERFFSALSSRSKADIRGIARCIESKSELEICDYLRQLLDEKKNRYLYAGEVDGVVLRDVPAATELSSECEALLEEAADALAIYQDKYDRAVGEQMHHERWLIDRIQAEAYDGKVDLNEDGNTSGDSPENESAIPAEGLFRLSSFLSLTERVFMNSDPSQSKNNWIIHAAHDEVPAITQGAVSDLYELTKYQLRKIMQTSVFCAESRIRSTGDRGNAVKTIVRKQDVAAAITILGVPEDSFSFWPNLARRNQLRVVDNHRNKRWGPWSLLDYDKVENILSEAPRGRRGQRSVSRLPESSSVPDDSDYAEGADMGDGIDSIDGLASDQSAEQTSFARNGQPALSSLRGDTNTSINHVQSRIEHSDTYAAASDQEDSSNSGDEEDRQLEILDQANSGREERKLYEDLGWFIPTDSRLWESEQREDQDEQQPTTVREAIPDLRDWRDSISNYVGSWGEYGHGPKDAQFLENRRQPKRRRTEDSGKQQELPFRDQRSLKGS